MKTAEKPVPDHFMYAVPDLDSAIADLEERTGVRAAYGGEHAGLGTHNALLRLGDRMYLEILAPIDAQSPALEAGGMLAGLAKPRLFMWAVSCRDILGVAKRATRDGYDAGRVIDMSRAQPGGGLLHWKLSIGGADVAGSVVPFLIEWGKAQHPAERAPAGCRVTSLRAEHPDAARIRAALHALQVELEVDAGSTPCLVLQIDTPRGPVTLR